MPSNVDLRQLAVDRSAAPVQRRRVLTRFALPAALLLGMAALLISAAWGRFFPPRMVTVLPVTSSETPLDRPVDAPLFRAAGWVEPRPTATIVTALAEGTLDKLLVVEGQEVKEGELVARLITADAQIALDAAQAEVKLREAELSSAAVALTAAHARLDAPLHVQIEVADAAAALAKAESELGNLPFQLRVAFARQKFAQKEHAVNTLTTGTVSELALLKSKSEMEAADAFVDELQGRQKRLPVEVAALKDKRDALVRKLALKTDEARLVGEMAAAERSAQARLSQAQSACDAAKLRLARMEIHAPSAGRVLSLVAKPGARLTGQDSSTVLTLYDPARLQVRVDVRLDDVGKVIAGQKATIESAALPGRRLDGTVLATTAQADVQKNTLSVKVGISDPPATLKPEMLCQVVFLAPPQPNEPTKASASRRLLAPKQLIESGNRVWVVDLRGGVALARTVQTGADLGDLVEIVSGLEPTDWLIVGGREGLRAGDRIAVAGEDETLGFSGDRRK